VKQAEWTLNFGQWLFRHRSVMPAFFAVALLPALDSFQFIQNCHVRQVYWELGCLAISLSGLFVRCMTVAFIREGSSGRELSTPRADRLNTSGLYSVVRNPLYLGNMIIWFGIISMLHQWWLSGLILLISYIYHRTIIVAEEAYLSSRFGADYLAWRQRTPAFIPDFRRWIPPELPFSGVMILRREYSGLFQVIAAFALMNMVLHHAVTGVWVLDSVFMNLLIEGAVLCGMIWLAVYWASWLPSPKDEVDTTYRSIQGDSQQKKM
jgi:protein-S-isoprenylcysteine O-methyltransferase Ste14